MNSRKQRSDADVYDKATHLAIRDDFSQYVYCMKELVLIVGLQDLCFISLYPGTVGMECQCYVYRF